MSTRHVRRVGWFVYDAIGYALGYASCPVCGRTYWRVGRLRTCVEWEKGPLSGGPIACFVHREALG
jgi:hypothetical protein